MSEKTTDIVYFSGTGGTARSAGLLAEKLRGFDHIVTVREIHVGNTSDDLYRADLLVLMYPVYASNAPEPAIRFLNSLPSGAYPAAAVISVSAGGEMTPNKACRRHAVRLLEKKGAKVQYEAMLVMPCNLLYETPEKLASYLLRILPEAIGRIARELSAGIVKRMKPGPFNTFASFISRPEGIGARWFGRHIKAGDGCTGCARCAESCPVGNISMHCGRPVFANKCVLCTRCLYGCPAGALRPGVLKSILLKNGYDLSDYEKNSRSVDFASAYPLTKGLLWIGARKYLEQTKQDD